MFVKEQDRPDVLCDFLYQLLLVLLNVVVVFPSASKLNMYITKLTRSL